jgi:hypothetical protein
MRNIWWAVIEGTQVIGLHPLYLGNHRWRDLPYYQLADYVATWPDAHDCVARAA